ncbi:hypothetical protein CBR_g54929 [Chara braunii]|uniref:Uncharacterized protein n=1 Tax=Chara braunii TaxID=69332 RepID=A0A388JPW9_CHABU|nr:hypothetical protein CBR_g54929 [Chara braunii]|eukprot:GBG59827.1 hypothetical protein CBR_g54929 [Chara braunii]
MADGVRQQRSAAKSGGADEPGREFAPGSFRGNCNRGSRGGAGQLKLRAPGGADRSGQRELRGKRSSECETYASEGKGRNGTGSHGRCMLSGVAKQAVSGSGRTSRVREDKGGKANASRRSSRPGACRVEVEETRL